MITLSKNDEKRTENQVKLLIGTGLLLGALGIAYAIGQAIGSNIQPIKQNFILFLNFALQHFNIYSPLRVISFFSLSFISIGLTKFFKNLKLTDEVNALLFPWFVILTCGITIAFFFTLFS